MSTDRFPGATFDATSYEDFPFGVVIIAAHNESNVIERTLSCLSPLAADQRVEVIVACNGCTDDTAELARAFAGVKVLNLPEPSKIAALNAADAATSRWPRLYLDADIEIDPRALRKVFETLRRGDVLAARPAFRYDTEGASLLVRSFYRARARLRSTNSAMWGAGAFGLSEEGHRRFGTFPAISPRFSGDDLFVDQQFLSTEKTVLDTPPVSVRVPRRVASLVRTLRRNYRAQAQVAGPTTTSQTMRELIASVRGMRSAFDAAVYAAFVAVARMRRRQRDGSQGVWERDETSRV